ncbi:MAG: hypothetical protein C5B52_06050 [Bacteroidetes bacterium]|nr:MAG: hypothetical protein C5B52_06050 [Bacteroidota bacterium]
MNRTLRHILLALVFFLCSTLPGINSFGQSPKDTTSYPDTVSAADTVAVPNSNEAEPNHFAAPDSSTLFFVGKADSTVMYDTTAVSLRSVPDSIGKKLKSDGDFWYANKAQEKKKEENNESFWDKFWNGVDRLISKMFFRSVIWVVLILIFIGIIIWLLIQNNISIFASGKNAEVSGNESSPELNDINLIDFPLEIANAEQNNDLRLATRLRFLKLLKYLSDNNRIVYGPDKTNMDYLMQLFNTNLYEDFSRVTRNYEYVWYGNFEINAIKYGIIKNEFEKLNQSLA